MSTPAGSVARTTHSRETIIAQITRMTWKILPKKKSPVTLVVPKLPISLTPVPPHNPTDAKPNEPSWQVKLDFLSNEESLTLLSGKETAQIFQGKASLSVTLAPGLNTLHVTAINAHGLPTEYEGEIQVETQRDEIVFVPEAKAFLIVAPVFYQRTIMREGTVIGDSTKASALTAGARAIYRRRLLKDITDLLPGKFKVYADASGTVGKTITGDSAAQGLPIWADVRTTLEVVSWGGFRIEGGAGFSFFMPNLSQSQAGDVEQFFGFTLSARVGYPITSNLYSLLGFSTSLPSSSSSSKDFLVSTPLEVFASFSIPRGTDGFWELRVKYYQISTNGSVVSGGTFSRKESFFGPELLWVKKF